MVFLITLLQAASPAHAVGAEVPRVTAPRVETEVVVDGVLDEPVWQQAARLTGFRQYEPVDGRPAEERTEVLVWYAPDALYFGILAYDSQPATIRATRADRDNIGAEDHVVIYLDTFNDRRRAAFFAVNALGVQQDGVRSEGASSAGRMFGGNIDTNPDYLFDSRGRMTEDGYVVEVRIPFKSLRYPAEAGREWGLNVVRRVQRTGYTDTWTDVRRAGASFLAQAGTLAGLHDLRRGVVLEAQPFLTAKANGERVPQTGRFVRESVDPDVGLNVQLGFTNLTLDGTLNPDFSQVESDASQVTVNERFALFFPEKRPFFLEGIDLFNTPSQLVYTRRIVDPVAGAKLTGKLGSVGVAHISAVDEGAARAPDALFNVTRLRRDFGANSLVGVTYTDRSELRGGAFNRVLAADARLVFARLYYFEAQLGRSWTRDADQPETLDPSRGDVAGASSWKLEVDRTGRSFGFNYSINAFDDEFRTDAGFVPRTGIVNAHAFNRVSWYGTRGALLETVTMFFGPTRYWRYGDLDEDAIEGGENANFMLRFRGGWQTNARIARDFVELETADYTGLETPTASGPQPYLPLARISGPSLQLGLTTPTYQLFDATLSAQRGRAAIFAEGSEGTSTSLTGSLSLRPSTSLRVTGSTSFRWLTRRRDGSEFARSIIPRVKAEYQPVRSFFFRTVAEYRSERLAALRDARTGAPLLRQGVSVAAARINELRVDLLASFEPSPGTVAFLGYGASLGSDNTFAISDLSRTADGFFLKLAYQFRR